MAEPGLAVYSGRNGWLPDLGREVIVLSKPVRTLTADTPAEIPGLLADVEEEQHRGNYAAGYLAYEAGEAFGLAAKPLAPDAPPLAWIAVYEPGTVRRAPIGSPVASSAMVRHGMTSTPRLNVTKTGYVAAIDRVRELIAAGDTYQVNYTVRVRFKLEEDPLHYFLARALAHPVPYGAYLDLGDTKVVSLSPELYLRRVGARLESRPMKGTRPRSPDRTEDITLAYDLAGLEKDRAENLMIVDMVRNDLGRVCRTGSVHVPTLFAVEPYGTVWQMVSTVEGEVRRGAGLADIFAATFPGASVTGAPKHHTMEIIRDVETEPRGVYTGTVGIFLPGGDFTCNLAIRTIVHHRRDCLLGVGSGVVWDSDPDEEYEETLDKAAFAFPRTDRGAERPRRPGKQGPETTPAPQADLCLFETLLLEAEGKPMKNGHGRYRYLAEHLGRMAASATALGLPFDRKTALARLGSIAAEHKGSVVVRLDLDRGGALTSSVREAPATPAGPVEVLVSPFRTDPDDVLLRHKTTRRDLYDRERRRATQDGFFEVVFMNRLDHVTEGAITNVFARFDHTWVTPPLEDGLLPGIWRQRFVEQTSAEERPLSLYALLSADEVVLGNSVRGPVRVTDLVAEPLTT